MFLNNHHHHIQKKQGCKKCNESKGEKEISSILSENKLTFTRQKRFKDCRNINPLPFDFYLPEKNICVEFDGEQHFMVKKHWGGEKS